MKSRDKCYYNGLCYSECDCNECRLYKEHIHPTGSFPILEWFINLFKRFKHERSNEKVV